MTAVAERVSAPTTASTLRALALVESRRYARQPLFLLGMALLLGVTVIANDLSLASGYGTVVPAFFLGLLGVVVGHQLTRSLAQSTEVIESAPADGVVRTAALCLACLVPGVVALAWVAWVYLSKAVWPVMDSSLISSRERAVMIFAGVVYAVGGPLVGVMVGRLTRFRGAGLAAALFLVVWTLLGSSTFIAGLETRMGNLVHLNAPFSFWVNSAGRDDPLLLVGGSPGWYLVYITLLCGLAATVALLHEASGATRSHLLRVLALLALLAAASLVLAAAPDPSWVTL